MIYQKIAIIKSKVLYADDTSVIITNHNPLAFMSEINNLFENINDGLNANLLSLNIDKTYFMHIYN